MKKLLVWVVLLAVVGVGGFFGWRWYQGRPRSGSTTYRTAEVVRTDIVSTISATGTVVPEDVVDVGA